MNMYKTKSFAALFFDEVEEYRDLEAQLRSELVSEPENQHILNNLGLIHFELGELEKAEEHFIAAKDLGSSRALESLCEVYTKTDRLGDAIDSIRSLIESEKDRYQIGVYHRTLARYFIDSSDIELALREYEKSLEIDPSFNKVYLLMAECLEKSGQQERGRNYRVKYGASKKL
ncbi:MAG: hypothetical protein OIF51_01580 [Cellvibrionaceae bacterium]|nr:hypothetical protein [Cellvibrionaceae bacterium]